jgi:MFS family permease
MAHRSSAPGAEPSIPQIAMPAAGGAAEAIMADQASASLPVTKLKKGYVAGLVIAYFATYLSWVAPSSFTLAVRLQTLDPAAKNTALAIAVGVPAVLLLVLNPIVGVLSDRTHARLGRRRTWLLAGTVMGLLGAAAAGLAPSVPLLILGWSVAYLGYGIAAGMVLAHLGDKLPEGQRGRVSGFTGAATQIAPVAGVIIAGLFVKLPPAMFIVPAIIAFIGLALFIIIMKDSPAPSSTKRFTLKTIVSGFWFNPSKYPDFAWVWLSRALLYLALAFMTVYTVYLLGSRLALGSAAIAGLVATAGLLSVVASMAGALLSGWLSDRLKRRKSFLFASAVILAAGLLLIATLTSVPQFFVGTLVSLFAIGIFGAVDQAIGYDVLPKEGQNGRYLAIFHLANQLPQAIGPFLAGAVVALAAGHYGVVYIVAACLAVGGGVSIIPARLKAPRVPSSDSIARSS